MAGGVAALAFEALVPHPTGDAAAVGMPAWSVLLAAAALGAAALALPAGVPEWLSPVVAIGPAQLFCYHLTRAKGFDTESPRGLRKVTLTR